VCPSNPYDAKGLLKTAIRDDNPVIFIEHTAIYSLKGEVPEDEYLVPFGEARVTRPGRDVTIVGYSGSVHQSMRAAAMLAEQDEIEAEVIDMRTLRPLDIETVVESIKKTGRAVIVEDDWRFGGFAGEIVALLQERAFDYLTRRSPECAAPRADALLRNLELAALPSEQQIPTRSGG
jgi:pyruvate dehydrogenase E1 component beta subunit